MLTTRRVLGHQGRVAEVGDRAAGRWDDQRRPGGAVRILTAGGPLASVVVLTLVALLAGRVTYAAFSSSTANPGNGFAAGTVSLGDDDAGVAILTLSSVLPGRADTGCIHVTYGGSLDASVRLYGTVSGALGPYLTLTVTRGTDGSPAFDSCNSFTPDSTDYRGAGPGVVYAGPLSAYPADYATAIPDPATGPVETWRPGEDRSYRFTVRLNNNAAAQGQTADATFTWEARNL